MCCCARSDMCVHDRRSHLRSLGNVYERDLCARVHGYVVLGPTQRDLHEFDDGSRVRRGGKLQQRYLQLRRYGYAMCGRPRLQQRLLRMFDELRVHHRAAVGLCFVKYHSRIFRARNL